MKKCTECHFLSKKSTLGVFSLDFEQREKVKNRSLEMNDRIVTEYRCYHEFWNEQSAKTTSDIYFQANEINRNNECFYFPFKAGILNEAASKIQERKEKIEKTKNAFWFAFGGLIFSGIALLLNAFKTFTEN